MKKINPLYFLALLITVLFITISQQKSLKEEIKETNQSFEELKLKASIYKDYNNQWLSKNNIEKRVQKIKNNPIFRDENIKIESLKNSFKITYSTKNRKKQSNFINMILNDSFVLKSINFNKEVLVMEVGVK